MRKLVQLRHRDAPAYRVGTALAVGERAEQDARSDITDDTPYADAAVPAVEQEQLEYAHVVVR